MPTPRPPVGGIPCSIAVRNSSSRRSVSSSSNLLRSSSCCSMRSRWSRGSFNSVKELHISIPAMNPSNLSTKRESSRFALANGDISTG